VALRRFLDAHVLPRIAGDLASRIVKDESVVFDRLHANRQALTGRGRWSLRRVTLPWSNIRAVTRRYEVVSMYGVDSSGRTRDLLTSSYASNAVALPFVVDLVQRGAGSTPPFDPQQFWRFGPFWPVGPT
jgi:hypothetical protein